MEVLTETEIERIDALLSEQMRAIANMQDAIDRTRRVLQGAAQLVSPNALTEGDRIRVKGWAETVQNVTQSKGGVLIVVRTNCGVHGYCADETVELVLS